MEHRLMKDFAFKYMKVSFAIILMVIVSTVKLAAIEPLYTSPPLASYGTLRVPSEEYPTIQAAINASTEGDTILVAPGTYKGYGNCDLYIWHYGQIVLMSESGPENTIIDCEGSSEYPHRALYLDYNSSPDNVVDGFTFRGGYDQYGNGGGIWVDGVSLTIQNCIFENNTGHALYCLWASPAVINCRFIGNSGDDGGAVRCSGGEAQFTNCTFENNSAQYNGGALYCAWSSPTVTGCLFDGNTAQRGGAIYYYASSAAYLMNCTFVNNSAKYGGGIYFNVGDVGPSTISNCIIAFSTQGGAIYYVEYVDLSLFCCDIYGNAGGDWVGYIADQEGENGNFSDDPLFCDFANGDYQITENSPCAPANNSCGVLIGAYGVGCGAIEIVLSPTSIDFSAVEGEDNPPPDTLTITNAGGRVLTWMLSKSSEWLSVSDSMGTAPSTVIVSADISGLPAGVYADTIIVISDDAVNSPQRVPVTLTINTANRPPEFVEICNDTELVEGDKFECEIVVSDPDGDPIDFMCQDCPDGAVLTNINATTALFSFEPDYQHVDSGYTVIIEASDGVITVSDSFTISVVNRQLEVISIQPHSGEDQDFLISWKPIQILFNEALQESSLETGLTITSRKGDLLSHAYEAGQYFLTFDNTSDYLMSLDTIICTLRTSILDMANNPLDSEYVYAFYTGVAVFPGDANDDGIVDERDILPMGLYWGNEGPSRPDSGDVSWDTKPAHVYASGKRWTPLVSVYVDADGSGKVDANDICGVTSNWAQQVPSGKRTNQGDKAGFETALKQLEGNVLQQMYEALTNCPESEGKASVMRMFESLLDEPATNLPTTYNLSQNYPNPFNPYTVIQFYLPQSGHVTLSVYNIMGQKVVVLLDGYMDKGYGEVTWDGADQSGRPVASGIYFYRLEGGEVSITKRMMLLK